MPPIKLFRGWWLCKDTTIPVDYPPKCREMLVRQRLEIVDKNERLSQIPVNLGGDRMGTWADL